MRRALVLFGVLGALNTGNGMAKPSAGLCAPSAEILGVLGKNKVEAAARLEGQDARDAFSILQGLLKHYPDELFIHVQYQDLVKYASGEKLEEVTAQYRDWAESRSEDPLYLYLYGRMLTGTQEDAAADYYRRALEKDPGFPRAHLALTYVYTRTAARDLEKAKGHLQTFLQLCPNSVEGYSYLGELGDPEFQRSMATEWRRRLLAQPGAETIGAYPTLWELEFKLAPSAEHPALRARAAADLEAIRALDLPQAENWLGTLEQGYELAGNSDQVRWVREQRATRFPDSPAVRIQALEDWGAAHPEPALDAEPAEVEAYYRELLAVSEEWTRRWPEEPMSWLDRLSALSELKEAAAADVEQAGEKLLATWEKKGRSLQTAPGTVPLRIARAYLRRKAALQRIPDLVRTGIEAGEQEAKRLEGNAALPARIKEGSRRGERLNRWMGWSLLFDTALESGQKQQAQEAFAKLEEMLRQDEAATAQAGDVSLAQQRGDYWGAAARLEELEGRKLEALVFYQNALAAGLEDPVMPDWKEARGRQLEAARRLWTELGGTSKGWDRWFAGRKAPRPGSQEQGAVWEAREKAMPDFKLADLQGKTWSLAELRGKTVFVNVWATWCVPCKQELPDVQKLHDQLAGRTDAVLFTLNIDSNPGLIEPFLNKHNYTFPVLLGEGYFQAVVESMSIPRSWIVDGQGVMRYEQVGYSGQKGWVEQAMSRLDGLRGEQPK